MQLLFYILTIVTGIFSAFRYISGPNQYEEFQKTVVDTEWKSFGYGRLQRWAAGIPIAPSIPLGIYMSGHTKSLWYTILAMIIAYSLLWFVLWVLAYVYVALKSGKVPITKRHGGYVGIATRKDQPRTFLSILFLPVLYSAWAMAMLLALINM